MPLVLSDPICAAEVAHLHDHGAVFYYDDPAHPREKRFVVGNSVRLREAPSTDAVVYQKLGYGVQVSLVAAGCADGWTLVVSPYGGIAHGIGFIRDDLLATSLLTELQVDAKRASAGSPVEAASWAAIEAAYHPSAEHTAEAAWWQDIAQTSLATDAPSPCDTHYGACELLAHDTDFGGVAVPAAIDEVGVAPWWILPSADRPAKIGIFRAAYLATTGECDCCGCVPCATSLQVDVDPIDGPPERMLGATRRPPASWFVDVSQASCVGVEAAVRAAPLWRVPPHPDQPGPAHADEGACVPGEDGSAWWVQGWDVDDSDSGWWEGYRVWPGGRVSVRRGGRPLALRDLNGDGDVETLWDCSWGWCDGSGGLFFR